MSDRDTIAAMKALHEGGELLQTGKVKLGQYLKMMDTMIDGSNSLALFEVIDKVTEESEDDIQSMLIVAIGSLARVRATIRGTALEKELRTTLGLPKPEVAEVQEPLADEN